MAPNMLRASVRHSFQPQLFLSDAGCRKDMVVLNNIIEGSFRRSSTIILKMVTVNHQKNGAEIEKPYE